MLSIKLITKSSRAVKTAEFPGNFLNVKFSSRWTHRRPLKVLTPEEFDNEMSTQEQRNETDTDVTSAKHKDRAEIKWRHATLEIKRDEPGLLKKSVRRARQSGEKQKQTSFDMLQTIIDAEGNFVYTKMENNDARISTLLTFVKSKRDKAKKSLILLEGKRLIKEALQNGCKLQFLLFSRKDELEFLKDSLPKSGAHLYKMPYREMQMWSDLTVCPGVMGIFVQPDVKNFTPSENPLPVTVICDNIREPGNLGSVLRTCAAAGCQKVILTKGCVNVWDTKVTRGGSGAHFRLQIQSKLDWHEIEESLGENCKVFVADNTTDMSNERLAPLIPYYGLQFNSEDPIVLILGGETDGLSDEAHACVRSFNGVRLNVPLVNDVDSLNSGVALGVIIFEIKRQLTVTRNVVEENRT